MKKAKGNVGKKKDKANQSIKISESIKQRKSDNAGEHVALQQHFSQGASMAVSNVDNRVSLEPVRNTSPLNRKDSKKRKATTELLEKPKLMDVSTTKDITNARYIYRAKSLRKSGLIIRAERVTGSNELDSQSYYSRSFENLSIVNVEEEDIDVERSQWLLDDDYEHILIKDVEEYQVEDTRISGFSPPDSAVCSVLVKNQFLESFSGMPEIEEVSDIVSTEDETHIEVQESAVKIDPNSDAGAFVDPLTGEVITSSSEEELNLTLRESEHAKDRESLSGEEAADEDAEAEFDEELLRFQSVALPAKSVQIELDNAINAFMEFEREFAEVQMPTKVSDSEVVKTAKMLRTINTGLLYELCDTAVDAVENIDEMEIFRRKLCKETMYKDLLNLYEDYLYNSSIHEFYERYVTEYYVDRRVHRLITEITGFELAMEREEYEREAEHLDISMKKEVELYAKHAVVTQREKNELNDVLNQLNKAEEDFGNLIRNTLMPSELSESSGFLNEINHYLKDMNVMRTKVGRLRTILLTIQDFSSRLQTQWEETEQLSENIFMQDIVTMQLLNIELEKKFLDRNAYVNRFRTRVNKDMHLVAHGKEQNDSDSKLINILTKYNVQLIKRVHNLRKELSNQKIQDGKIRALMNDLRSRCGIMEFDSLLYSYDEMVIQEEKILQRVNSLKQQFKKVKRALHLE